MFRSSLWLLILAVASFPANAQPVFVVRDVRLFDGERVTEHQVCSFRTGGLRESADQGLSHHLTPTSSTEQAGELRLANLNNDLKALFEATKLDTLLQIDDDEGGGLAGRPARPRPPVRSRERPKRIGRTRPSELTRRPRDGRR